MNGKSFQCATPFDNIQVRKEINNTTTKKFLLLLRMPRSAGSHSPKKKRWKISVWYQRNALQDHIGKREKEREKMKIFFFFCLASKKGSTNYHYRSGTHGCFDITLIVVGYETWRGKKKRKNSNPSSEIDRMAVGWWVHLWSVEGLLFSLRAVRAHYTRAVRTRAPFIEQHI